MVSAAFFSTSYLPPNGGAPDTSRLDAAALVVVVVPLVLSLVLDSEDAVNYGNWARLARRRRRRRQQPGLLFRFLLPASTDGEIWWRRR